jgi:hypothetical protein
MVLTVLAREDKPCSGHITVRHTGLQEGPLFLVPAFGVCGVSPLSAGSALGPPSKGRILRTSLGTTQLAH